MRNLYLVAYDIQDPKRWRRVFRTVRGHGHRLQYSVFYCFLSPKERVLFVNDLDELIDHAADRVIIVNLGGPEVNVDLKVEFLGEKIDIVDHQATII